MGIGLVGMQAKLDQLFGFAAQDQPLSSRQALATLALIFAPLLVLVSLYLVKRFVD